MARLGRQRALCQIPRISGPAAANREFFTGGLASHVAPGSKEPFRIELSAFQKEIAYLLEVVRERVVA